MSDRKAVSLLEFLVVLAIIAVLIGLLLPAFSAARRRAMDIVCKNNLKQINLAVAQYVEIQKQLPPMNRRDAVGGWIIEILPFLDQKNLRDRITPGAALSAAPDFLRKQPRLLTCPMRDMLEPHEPTRMDYSHYVLVPGDKRKSYLVCDSPIAVKVPWSSGPEFPMGDVLRQTGPHNRGFFVANGFQEGVGFVPSNPSAP
jgi:prepilin-type N-terminal cleavage/methylation domain-containing protein